MKRPLIEVKPKWPIYEKMFNLANNRNPKLK